MKPTVGSGADADVARSREQGGTRRRVAWTIVDQAVASFTNVGTAVVAARTLDRQSFGAFGLAYAVYLLALGSSRAVITEPLLSRHSGLAPDRLRAVAREAAGAATALGLVASVGLLVAAAIVGGPSGRALAALAVVLPGLLLQDSWRYCFVAARRPTAAVANDSGWCVVQILALAALATYGTFTVTTVLLWWGGSGIVAAVIGCRQSSAMPRLSSAWPWIRDHLDLGGRYAAEFATATGAGQGTLLILGAVAGLVALGAIRGAQVFFGPVNVLFSGIYMALVPEGVRLVDNPRGLRRLMVVGSLGLVAAAGVWLLAGLGLPARLGRALFGETWNGSRSLLVPVGIAVLGGGAASGAIAGLRAMAAAGASLQARLLGLPLAVLFPLAGARVGPEGFAVGLAIATWGGALIWWYQFHRALAEHPRDRAGADLRPLGVLTEEGPA